MMKRLVAVAALALIATPAFAGGFSLPDLGIDFAFPSFGIQTDCFDVTQVDPCTNDVPEMDAGAGVTALALLVGATALIREKLFRK